MVELHPPRRGDDGNGVMRDDTTSPTSTVVRLLPRKRRQRIAGSLWFLVLLGCAILVVVVTVRPLAAPPPAAPAVVASLPFWNLGNGTSTVLANRQTVNEVSPWMYGLGDDGRITSQVPPDQTAAVRANIEKLRDSGIPIVPSLANITGGNWSYEPVARMLHDPARMKRHVAEIAALVRSGDFSGIDIDYENLRGQDRGAFTAFVNELAAALHSEGKTLSVAVFAKTTDGGYDERNVAQDYAALGRVADQVRLMGYDYHWGTSPPGPVAPIGWIREVVGYAKTQIPPNRIVLGVPLYGYDWVDGQGTAVTWLQAFRRATEHQAKPLYDNASQTPWFRYTDERGRPHEVWFENSVSSKAKFEAARGSGIRGVYLWMYGYEDTATWSELQRSLPVDQRPGQGSGP
jgi:spore germination protein